MAIVITDTDIGLFLLSCKSVLMVSRVYHFCEQLKSRRYILLGYRHDGRNLLLFCISSQYRLASE
nr:MAG TPA: hypothetical protein [Caudoviricetes sp.]